MTHAGNRSYRARTGRSRPLFASGENGKYGVYGRTNRLNPATGKMREDEIQVQTDQVLRNLTAVLAAAGTDLAHVVKTTVFLKDMGEFAAMNEVYGRYFPDSPPARSAVQAAALPLNARVEIEAIALLP